MEILHWDQFHMDKSVRISVFVAHTSEIDMLKFAIKYYRDMIHAHPLKNPKGKESRNKRREMWESKWTLMYKGEKRIRIHSTEQWVKGTVIENKGKSKN